MFIAPLGAIIAGANLSNSECLICTFNALFTWSLGGLCGLGGVYFLVWGVFLWWLFGFLLFGWVVVLLF